jgi:hypothetical protein
LASAVTTGAAGLFLDRLEIPSAIFRNHDKIDGFLLRKNQTAELC